MKSEPIQSAIKEWVFHLPFTQQALLMLALRGPDGSPKFNTAKQIVHYLRDAVINPAYPYDGENDGFMRADYENWFDVCGSFFKDTDSYPMHFLMHLIHAGEVIAYNHPVGAMRDCWLFFYEQACRSFHMNPETKEQLNERLSK
jgi:hypothetical protein